jgi:hypothetical protein
MSNKKTHPRLCVVFFPPYDKKLGCRPHGVLMARLQAETLQQFLIACTQGLPHRELTSARGAGQFFIGLETGYDAHRPASEYQDQLITWTGTDSGGHYIEFLRSHLQRFFEVKQAA